MARWCAAQGARVTVLDNRVAPPQAAALAASVPSATLAHGAFDALWIHGSDIRAVFISPGLSPQQTAALVEAATAQGLWVGGELSLFAHGLAALAQSQQYQPSVLAITGTNGKTTVTALTGELLRAAGKTVAVAGNIGPTLLDTLTQVLADGALPQVWVLELSSFQLHYADGFDPTAAVVLNISQDHLDWHPDLAHYAASKARIFGAHTLMVLNRDDAAVMYMLPAPTRAKQRLVERAHVCFGLDTPQRPGDYGLESVGGMVWIVRALEADETLKPARFGGNTEAPELHTDHVGGGHQDGNRTSN
jgi:UDP-N-acetylmuramoylalanine--D-glutamate ligase